MQVTVVETRHDAAAVEVDHVDAGPDAFAGVVTQRDDATVVDGYRICDGPRVVTRQDGPTLQDRGPSSSFDASLLAFAPHRNATLRTRFAGSRDQRKGFNGQRAFRLRNSLRWRSDATQDR
jgi:hypothetical protein